jgi:phenylacetate-CoA ligase
MGLLEKIYDKSPIFLQNLMVTISGYQRNRTRYGKVYHEYKSFLSNFDTLSLKEKLNYQEKELVKFVKYANENSKFYNELYKNVNIDEIQSIQDLKKLPIVDKEMLRKNINEVFTIPSKNAVEGHTGGTTGKSLIIYYTLDDMMKRMAILDHFKSRVGFENLKMKRATFNGKHIIPTKQKKPIFWRYNYASKQMIYSSFHLTESNMKFYVESLNRYKPQAIDGFFMSIVDVASYINRHNINLNFSPLAVFPTSETLTKSGRELIEKVFNCKVYDQYASSEGAPFVTECKNQNLHIEMSSGIIEQYDQRNTEVLVTSFTTHGTPLIRYKIGDAMTFDLNKNTICSCCIESLIVKEIQGRKLDYLYSSTGSKVSSVNIANGFKNIPNAIIRAQVIQEKIGEVIILLEIDKKLYKSTYDKFLSNEFKHKFGFNTNIIIEHVESIQRESSGKFRLVVNRVDK